jgi:hypothetical protein
MKTPNGSNDPTLHFIQLGVRGLVPDFDLAVPNRVMAVI